MQNDLTTLATVSLSVCLLGGKINLWTKVCARSLPRLNFSFACFQENGEKCASYCGGFSQSFYRFSAYRFCNPPTAFKPSSSSSSPSHLFLSRKRKKKGVQRRDRTIIENRTNVPSFHFIVCRSLMKNKRIQERRGQEKEASHFSVDRKGEEEEKKN